MMAPRAPWETAQIPLAVVSMNPFQNLKQMGDQRVAKVSHIVLAPGQCPLPLNEALELLEQWKQEIGDDAEKFAERARATRSARPLPRAVRSASSRAAG